jgi:hypothetical protein
LAHNQFLVFIRDSTSLTFPEWIRNSNFHFLVPIRDQGQYTIPFPHQARKVIPSLSTMDSKGASIPLTHAQSKDSELLL